MTDEQNEDSPGAPVGGDDEELSADSPTNPISVLEAASTGSNGRDPFRLPVSIASLALLLLGLLGWAVGAPAAKATGFLLFALIGFGGAWLLALRKSEWPSLAFSAPLGLSFTILVGFVLVETRTWSAGTPLFIVAVVGAAALHVWEVLQAGRRWRMRGGHLGDWRHPRGVTASTSIVRHHQQRGRTRQWVAIGLALAGLVACTASAAALHGFDPKGPSGLLGAISPAWYLGMALIVSGIIVGFSARATWAIALPVLALQLALSLTPALVYTLPRYSWTFKHLGVTAYILLHGSVNPRIDIYQAWPGLFAGVAWLCHAVGIVNPIPIARWWPTVIDVLRLLVFQQLAVRVLRDSRRAWLASAILVVGNMIGQDYYSPQATGFFLVIAVFAVVYRRPRERRGLDAKEWVLVLGMVVAIVVTHQLSPYMLAGAVVVLALFGLSRSWLLPIVTFACAVGWALLHFTTVRHYFNFNQFGHIATNVLTRGQVRAAKTTTIHKAELIHLNAYVMATEVFVIGILALLVLAQRRTRVHIALAVCAASGVGLLLTNSYGNEGVFRVVLFALPWAAILCADWDSSAPRRLSWLPVAALPILLGGYVFVDMGLDYIYATRPGDLKAIQTFESTAPSGARLCILGRSYAPIKSSGRYNIYQYRDYPYVAYDGIHHFNVRTAYDDFLASCVPHTQHALRRRRFYAFGGQQPEANLIESGLATPKEYAALEARIASSGNWKLVQRTNTAQLYVLVSLFADSIPPSVTGDVQDGFRITASRGHWISLRKLRYAWQWELCTTSGKACTPILGADHPSFLLRAAEVGHRLRLIERVTDTKGVTRSVTTHMTGLVAKPNPPVEFIGPTVTGIAREGGRLVADGGRWRSPDHLTRRYQWEVCSSTGTGCTPIAGATKDSLGLKRTMLGHDLTVLVTVTDQEGQSTSATAPPIGPVQVPVPPALTAAPSVTGTPAVGALLSASTGSWNSPDKLSFTYQWDACTRSFAACTAIPRATGHLYRPTSSVSGKLLFVIVTATDREGEVGTAESAAVGPVAP